MNVTNNEFKSIDEYINSFPKDVKTKLTTLRQTIKEVAPQAQERVSYKMPALTLNGRIFIYFAAWKKHISLYPFTSEMEASFKESAAYKQSGKGTIQFQIDQPLPLPLIRKIIKYRMKENMDKYFRK